MGTSAWFSSTSTLSIPQTEKRSEQVLNRLHRSGLASQTRGVLHPRHETDIGRDLQAIKVKPFEDNAVVRCGGLEAKGSFVSRMESDTRTGYRSPDRFLRICHVVRSLLHVTWTLARSIPPLQQLVSLPGKPYLDWCYIDFAQRRSDLIAATVAP